MSASRQFVSWLFEANASLAFTTYQSGKVFFIGLQPNGRLSIFERTFNRCMGMAVTDTGFYMSSLYQLWRFENILVPGQGYEGYDRAYLPINGHTTGDLDVHDIAVDATGRPVFVNTLFSCLATVGETESFVPLWKPPFVSKLAAEDRCHLNGMAMVDGKPKYVTAVAETDVPDGWRNKRRDGGIIMDVPSGEIVASGLSMPHSPRVHGGKLWLLNSGTGEFGHVDVKSGKFEAVAFCPGYLRGLSFHGDYALIGLSKPRENGTFSGLALDEELKARKADAQCGLYVIDLRSGDVAHWLRIDGAVEELYDVVFLPGVRRPMAFGFKSDEIRRTLNVGAFGEL
ncbi:MAG: TIGR03032 family protein [Rhodospirillaceae bacterium]|nr:TIGR03032 family protein [Rhodospirillaceae bacterium]